MLNTLIRAALRHRLLVIAIALLVAGYGGYRAVRMPVDVFPDLNRPRVVVMTEAPGLAPEEVETLITLPIETALNGAQGVETVRSSSGVGVSVIYVEFGFDTDVYVDRQVVNERLMLVQDRLPAGVQPQLAPISSIMGQILILGLWSVNPETDPLELRGYGDWVLRQRLMTIPGVAQIFTIGGGRKQYQVEVDPNALVKYGVTLAQVKEGLAQSNENATGGYLEQNGPNELLVRSLGRIQSVEQLEKVVIAIQGDRPVSLSQVARVSAGAQVKRGDGAAFVREVDPTSSIDAVRWSGGPAVVLTISKQPGADTRRVHHEVMRAVEQLRGTLPRDYRIASLYAQNGFIDRAIENVLEALRDGGILVLIVLFLFLMNLRTTFISLTAIPLSVLVTVIVFEWMGISINTMTLGGLAVALGELVDDAIVDVENVFRRLRENRLAANPQPALRVVFRASSEVRNSIVFSTVIVVLVFIPLFGLGGMEGRLFQPLAVAYVVSILASLLVSLTVTPVLAYWLLGSTRAGTEHGDGFLLRGVKGIVSGMIRLSLRFPRMILGVVVIAVAISSVFALRLEKDFLPPFNEGSVQLNLLLPPGTSLAVSSSIAADVEEQLRAVPDIVTIGRRTGRAELDEHAEGVNASELILELDPDSPRNREEQLTAIREAVGVIPGVAFSVEQPISHLISHMLSGVKAQIGVKLYGDDLDVLRRKAQEMQGVMKTIPGVRDLIVEPQVTIPQLRIELSRDQLLNYGLSAHAVNQFIETALNGAVVSEVLEGRRSIDLVVRLMPQYRQDVNALKRLSLELPGGGRIPLEAVADVYESGGPNTINRENVQRRIVLQCNVTGRGVVDVVEDMKRKMEPIASALPSGYFIEYGGQFQSQQEASRVISLLFCISLAGIFIALYTLFRSVNLALQVMSALPMAFIGSVVALVLTGQTLTIASMVGFISLAGIASRNGILLLQHYLHLVRKEGETFSQGMIVRAGLERVAPVLMTALTAGIGLVPLVLSAGEAGKEILYPVATVILGGVISSTLLDFLVHPALFWLFGRGSAERLA